jgi:F0F1-type ATP synthase membrane subunit b/b'
MSDRNATTSSGGFRRVLDAETTADARLAAGHEEAAAIRQRARAEARAIAARADRRLQALHADMQEDIGRAKARMAQAFEAARRDLSAPPDEARVQVAAKRLARRLAGIDSS